MCAHSSSGQDVTKRIADELYPFIDHCFLQVVTFIRQNAICDGATVLFDQFYNLKSEFESLKNYNVKLVFPSVLKVFNTKDDPAMNLQINIPALQELTMKKENAIALLVAEIELEAELLQLENDHPVFPLIQVFKFRFTEEKKVWNEMLHGWNKGCACFVAARKNIPMSELKIQENENSN